MTIKYFALALACLCAACGSGAGVSDASPPSDAALHMDSASQTRMGVATEAVGVASSALSVEGFARVVDVGPLAALDGELFSAEAAASASRAEYSRLLDLAAHDQSASGRAVEAARAQSTADAARAQLARRRVGLEWGAGLEHMGAGQRASLLSDIAAGRAALLRIDAAGLNAQVASATISSQDNAAPINVTILGLAAGVDAQTQNQGLLAIARGAVVQELPAGRTLAAHLQLAAPEEGFVVPSSALLREAGQVFVYVKDGAGAFARRDVSAGRMFGDAWFVRAGFSPGDEVAVEGAASLLAAENGPSVVD